MPDVVAHSKLTHDGALKLIQAGIAKAQQMGVPQCIAVVDDGCNLLAFVRMERARVVEGADIDKRLSPRTLVIGVSVDGKSVAYPLSALQKQSPIIDTVGSVPIVIVLGDDKHTPHNPPVVSKKITITVK